MTKLEIVNDGLLNNDKLIDFVFKNAWSEVNKNKIYLFHATNDTAFKNIIQDKTVYSSGGCMLGGLYCVPMYMEDNNKLRLHNLGAYYFKKEIPMMKNDLHSCVKPKGLIFEIECSNVKINGINYLDFGKLNFAFLLNSIYKLSNKEINLLINQVNTNILNSKSFILETQKLYTTGIQSYYTAKKYMELFNSTIPELNMLGYALFEAILKYIVTFQNDAISLAYKNRNEVFNWHYKDLIYESFPFLHEKFMLEKIYFDEKKFCNFIKERKLITNFSKEHFTLNICNMVINTFMQNFLTTNLYEYNVKDTNYFIANPNLFSLIGQITNRILKSEKYTTIYSDIEKVKANHIWDYMVKNNILLTYNNIVFKGELCINPKLINKYKYNVYQCDEVYFNEATYMFYANKGTQLDIVLSDKMICYCDSSLR